MAVNSGREYRFMLVLNKSCPSVIKLLCIGGCTVNYVRPFLRWAREPAMSQIEVEWTIGLVDLEKVFAFFNSGIIVLLWDLQIRTYGRVRIETTEDEETEAAVQKFFDGEFWR